MSVVEDVRNALQDFLSPEIRELKVRIEAVERKVDDLKGSMHEQFRQVQDQFQQVQDQFQQAERRSEHRQQSIEEQFQQVERRAERRHDEMSFLIRQGLEFKNLAERVAAIEEKLRATH